MEESTGPISQWARRGDSKSGSLGHARRRAVVGAARRRCAQPDVALGGGARGALGLDPRPAPAGGFRFSRGPHEDAFSEGERQTKSIGVEPRPHDRATVDGRTALAGWPGSSALR